MTADRSNRWKRIICATRCVLEEDTPPDPGNTTLILFYDPAAFAVSPLIRRNYSFRLFFNCRFPRCIRPGPQTGNFEVQGLACGVSRYRGGFPSQRFTCNLSLPAHAAEPRWSSFSFRAGRFYLLLYAGLSMRFHNAPEFWFKACPG